MKHNKVRITQVNEQLTSILVYSVCLVNKNEAIKLCDLKKPQLDARLSAITLIQAAL